MAQFPLSATPYYMSLIDKSDPQNDPIYKQAVETARLLGEAGFAMAALLVTLAVMFLGMSVATPTWQYLVKDMKEEELIFRGGQIADAIQRFQAKNGNAVPPSLEVLVQGRYLRKLYTDPMTKDGEWRLIHQGEVVGPVVPPGQTRPGATPRRPAAPSRRPGTRGVLGGIVGVASTSPEEGLRLFNGRSRYDQWVFQPGQPRIVGRTIGS